jgi:hypothetical protein
VVVKRRHLEDALSGEAERGDLDDDESAGDEQPPTIGR